MRTFTILFILSLLLPNLISGQCSCTNCDLILPTDGAASSTITLSGATNPTLGQNGQDLKAVHIHMVHDAIDELDINLIAPDGSSVLLSQNTGLSVGQNITFDICFVACSETAIPDPGFPANFNSGAGYQPNTTYTGIYHPSAGGGCFEDLTGSVNGDWVLDIFDYVNLDGGMLFDWSLEFYDNSGLPCQSACNIVSCSAEGGDIMGGNSQFCEGDPGLSFSFSPTYPGSPPDPAEYDYTYVISDINTDVILEYATNPDLTTYSAGEYKICGLSYLISDFSLIPQPNGAYTSTDLSNDISNNVFCADLSTNCETVTIEAPLADPDISGPALVCEGDIVNYTIENYDPSLTYTVNITQGSFGQFTYNGGNEATVEWLGGPGQICFEVSNICGTKSTCIDVTIEPLAPPIVITGNDVVCPGVVETYFIAPPPGSSQSYVVTVTGGTIINQTSTEVEIEWIINGGTNELCVELQGSNCPPPIECFSVFVEDFQLPNDLNSPAELCIGETGSSFITPDPAINSYNWYGTDISITSGQGTNAVNYTVDAIGIVTVCLEVETDCGTLGPVCQDITVSPPPDPVIDPFGPTCELDFSLNASTGGGNSVNWTQIEGPGTMTFSPNDQPFTNVTASSPGTYTIVISETSPLCSGYDTIEIEVWESPAISNIEFNCELDEYTVSFDITGGQAPYSVNGNQISGDQFTSAYIQSGNSFTFSVTDANGCTDMISDSYDCPCISDAGTMSIDLLEICAATSDIAYAVHNNDAFLDGNDIGFFILHDNSGTSLGTILDQNQSGQFTFINGMNFGQVYYISYVVGNELNGDIDLNDPCLSVSVGQPVIFYDRPVLSNTSASFSCELQFPLSVDPSAGVQQIQWEQAAGPGFSNFSDPQNENTFVTVTEAGTYTYIVIAMNAACADTLVFNFDVYGPPVISNFQENCSSLDEYTLTFTVNGSGGPYTTNLAGNFSGNFFTSDTLNTANTYSVTVTDVNGCSTDFSFGPVQCDCISEAGGMGLDTILLCETEDSIHIDFLGGSNLDGDDIEGFVIHSGSSNLLVDPVFQTVRSSFAIPAILESGKLYYVSHVLGNESNGQVDLNDPCLDVSQGQPLYIFPIPGFSVVDQNRTCANSLEVLLSDGGGGTATVISNSTNASVDLSVFSDHILVETDMPTTLEIVYEESNRKCSRSDTFSVDFLSNPSFANIQETCIGQSFVFSFDISGGTQAYILNGDTLSGNSYMSDTLPSGTLETFSVRDQNGCRSDTLRIQKDCNCPGDAGTVNQADIELCEGDDISLSAINLQDTLLESGDTLLFVLHDGSKDSLGSILAGSNGDTIDFDSLFQTNTDYFLTVLNGDILNGTVDLNDPCLDQTEGVRVSWSPLQNVDISSRDSSCLNDTLSIDITASGNFPFEIYLSSDKGRKKQLSVTQEDISLQMNIQYETEVWQIDSISGDCSGNLEGNIELTAVLPQDVQFNSSPEICNNSLFGSTLDLGSLLRDPSLSGNWSSPDISISGNEVDFDGAMPGTYTFIFNTEGFEGPCPGGTYSTTVEVIECDCPVLTLPEALNFCNSRQSFDLDSLIDLSFDGSWTLRAPGQQSNPPSIQGTLLQILNSSAGLYELVYTITDSFPAQCQKTYTLDLSIEVQLSAGEQTSIPVYCIGENLQIDLFNLLVNADEGGEWSHSDTLIPSMISIDEFSPGIHEFYYTHSESGICENSETKVLIELVSTPLFDVIITDISCFQAQDGRLDIQIEEDIYAPYMIYLNDNILDSTTAINLNSGTYSIEVVNSKGCSQKLSGLGIEEAEPINVNLGEDVILNDGESHTFTAITNLDDSAIQQIEWIRSNMEIDHNELTLSSTFNNEETLTIRITDQNGCTAEDQVSIMIRRGEIYIPNVFNPNSQNPENRQFGIQSHPKIQSINSFQIYDRWGDLLYDRRNVAAGTDEAYWDGWVNNELAPPGVYVYSLEYVDDEGRVRYLRGDVTLLP